MGTSPETDSMHILYVSYYFPPFNTIGAVRAGAMAKCLTRAGHTVTVVAGDDQPFAPELPVEIPEERVHHVRGWDVNAPVEALV